MARAHFDMSKERFGRRMLRRWQRSGLSVRPFCRSHYLAQPSFYFWRRNLVQRDRQPTKPAAKATGLFAAVRPVSEWDEQICHRGFRGGTWQHCGVAVGAAGAYRTASAAVLCSITATCWWLGLDAFAYLRDVLARLPTASREQLDELLLDLWLAWHPEACYSPEQERKAKRQREAKRERH